MPDVPIPPLWFQSKKQLDFFFRSAHAKWPLGKSGQPVPYTLNWARRDRGLMISVIP